MSPRDDHPYYRDRYWNEHPLVVEHLNRRATGVAHPGWMHHLLGLRDGRPFRRALILNAGNGWVERALVELGIVETAIGLELRPDFVAEATAAARAAGLPLEYRAGDINTDPLDDAGIDLVVNHAAAHHIARVDRVFRRIARLLPPDGTFVSWDYVGPHRNQYRARAWEAVHELHRRLPDDLRAPLEYPSLPAMLTDDPSEAIHSELILPTVQRYFEIDHLRLLGGAIGYPLLTHNAPLLDAPRHRSDPVVQAILEADEADLAAHPEDNLFAYVVAHPDHGRLDDHEALARWTAEEDEREAAAAARGGRYYEPTLVEHLLTRQAAGTGVPGGLGRRARRLAVTTLDRGRRATARLRQRP